MKKPCAEDVAIEEVGHFGIRMLSHFGLSAAMTGMAVYIICVSCILPEPLRAASIGVAIHSHIFKMGYECT